MNGARTQPPATMSGACPGRKSSATRPAGWAPSLCPRAYGGLGACTRRWPRFVTLCAADPSLGQIPQNHFAVLQNLRDMGSEPQKRRWFADVLAGHRLGNAGPERKGRAAHVLEATARLSRDAAGGLRVSGTRFTPRARPSRTGCPSVPRTRRAASCRSGCGAMRRA